MYMYIFIYIDICLAQKKEAQLNPCRTIAYSRNPQPPATATIFAKKRGFRRSRRDCATGPPSIEGSEDL